MQDFSLEQSLKMLAEKINEIAQYDGDFTTVVPSLSVHRPLPCIVSMALA